MKLTCAQMEILLSFYIENELSSCLKSQVEEHLNECRSCANKYEMIKNLFADMKEVLFNDELPIEENFTKTHFNADFDMKLSEYMDNELSTDENIKIKKLAITNRDIRKEFEDSYNIRRLMSDSFKKTKAEVREDFVKSVLKKLELDEITALEFHPAIKLLIAFTLSVLILASIILISSSM